MNASSVELWLHVNADGRVVGRWGDETAVWSLAEFRGQMRSDWYRALQRVRLLATPHNLRWIDAVVEYWLRGGEAAPAPFLAGDVVCMRLRLCDPDWVFRWFGGDGLPSSVGGWWRVTPASAPAYLLAAEMQRIGWNDHLTPRAEALLRAHPAWPAVSFCATASLPAAARLLGRIIDPRCHVDPENPNSTARLRDVCGVGAESREAFRLLMKNGGEERLQTDSEAARALDVWQSWAGKSGEAAADAASDDPRRFFQRLLGRTFDPGRAAKVCRRYLRFVRDVWLDQLTPPRRYVASHGQLAAGSRRLPAESPAPRLAPMPVYAPQLFVPRLFFKQPDEIAAWDAHVRRVAPAAYK